MPEPFAIFLFIAGVLLVTYFIISGWSLPGFRKLRQDQLLRITIVSARMTLLASAAMALAFIIGSGAILLASGSAALLGAVVAVSATNARVFVTGT